MYPEDMTQEAFIEHLRSLPRKKRTEPILRRLSKEDSVRARSAALDMLEAEGLFKLKEGEHDYNAEYGVDPKGREYEFKLDLQDELGIFIALGCTYIPDIEGEKKAWKCAQEEVEAVVQGMHERGELYGGMTVKLRYTPEGTIYIPDKAIDPYYGSLTDTDIEIAEEELAKYPVQLADGRALPAIQLAWIYRVSKQAHRE